MRRFLVLLILILAGINFCLASDDIFNHPSTGKQVSKLMPRLKDAACKFEQEKYIGDAVLKSGGNFKFIKDKGAIFETLYPIKSTVSYTSSQNKQINDIMVAISNNNFTYLDKNFNIYYKSENSIWTVGLKPKKSSVASSQINDIVIKGRNDIENIKINTMKNGITDISFKCTTN